KPNCLRVVSYGLVVLPILGMAPPPVVVGFCKLWVEPESIVKTSDGQVIISCLNSRQALVVLVHRLVQFLSLFFIVGGFRFVTRCTKSLGTELVEEMKADLPVAGYGRDNLDRFGKVGDGLFMLAPLGVKPTPVAVDKNVLGVEPHCRIPVR